MPSSGQGGPCCHCGRTNSCCWRRGPASKPILCNACGSRYLVKRSLDGYQPLQTRRDAGTKQQAGKDVSGAAVRRVGPVAGRVSKPKRAPAKRADSDAWSSGQEDSLASEAPSICLTDDSAGMRQAAARLAGASGAGADAAALAGEQDRAGQAAGELQPVAHAALTASHLKLSYITSQADFKHLGAADLSCIAGAFFASSLRLKPRKPMVVTVSAVW